MPYKVIENVTLKDGQPAELGVVTAPDSDWRARLCRFLNRPPQPEGRSLYDFLLTRDLPGLITRLFVMQQASEIVGCIVTTDAAGVGYINSTFVPRPERQKGIASALMGALEEDFTNRGGLVRFFTTRTGSPAETMFEKFGYNTTWERGGRTGMEQHYQETSWEDYFCEDATDLSIEAITWGHWTPHRALMWARKGDGHHPLVTQFETRMLESARDERMRWKGLVGPSGRLVGAAALRPHDRWVKADPDSYTVDLYMHPKFVSSTQSLFSSMMPRAGHVQTFLDASSDQVAFFEEQGFQREASLRDDFNHHDDSTRDVLVYGRTL